MTNEKKYFLQTLVIHGLMGFFLPGSIHGTKLLSNSNFHQTGDDITDNTISKAYYYQ